MSQKNVEVVRDAFEAFGRGDWDALLGSLDSEIEWMTTGQSWSSVDAVVGDGAG